LHKDYVIEVENLTFSYPEARKPALKNVTFKVKEGEFVLIAGPTGAGKTTLCLALAGLIPHTTGGDISGKILVKGVDTKKVKAGRLANIIGLVLQDPESQFIAGDVLHDVAFGLENIGLPREQIVERVNWAIKTVRLDGFENRMSFHLSGGQKQRVGIAAALALEPEILVLDEPTTELDPVGKVEVISTIKRLREKYKTTIIMATHEMENVVDIADKLFVLYEGSLVVSGKPKDLLTNVDLMKKLGVKPPQVAELSAVLYDKKLLNEIPVSFHEAISAFRKIIAEKTEFETRLTTESTEQNKEKPIIKVENLWFQYPEPPVLALRNVNLEIYSGEFVGIIGQNGSGKTTLVKHFNGLLKPSAGRVIVDGVNTREVSVQALSKKVGYVFQNPDHQIFLNTVKDEIAYGPTNLGLPQDEVQRIVDDILKMMKLEAVANDNPLFLSKGERQKVAVASVLSMKPEVLIVDEPTTGQDFITIRDTVDLLRKLNEEGKTIIIISHNMALVAEICKRVIVMAEGKILLDGSTKEVFSQPELLAKTFLEPPQITKLAQALKEYGFPPNILTVDEMAKLMLSIKRKAL
jgi:energy-coupling factor transport system ATP-binding protein